MALHEEHVFPFRREIEKECSISPDDLVPGGMYKVLDERYSVWFFAKYSPVVLQISATQTVPIQHMFDDDQHVIKTNTAFPRRLMFYDMTYRFNKSIDWRHVALAPSLSQTGSTPSPATILASAATMAWSRRRHAVMSFAVIQEEEADE